MPERDVKPTWSVSIRYVTKLSSLIALLADAANIRTEHKFTLLFVIDLLCLTRKCTFKL